MSLCMVSDVDQSVADRHQMRAMLMNSVKPILFVTTEYEGCLDVIAMAEAVAGGEEELRRNPICACYINVTSPLRHNAEVVRTRWQRGAERNVYAFEAGLGETSI